MLGPHFQLRVCAVWRRHLLPVGGKWEIVGPVAFRYSSQFSCSGPLNPSPMSAPTAPPAISVAWCSGVRALRRSSIRRSSFRAKRLRVTLWSRLATRDGREEPVARPGHSSPSRPASFRNHSALSRTRTFACPGVNHLNLTASFSCGSRAGSSIHCLYWSRSFSTRSYAPQSSHLNPVGSPGAVSTSARWRQMNQVPLSSSVIAFHATQSSCSGPLNPSPMSAPTATPAISNASSSRSIWMGWCSGFVLSGRSSTRRSSSRT